MAVLITGNKGKKELEFQAKRVVHLAKEFIKSVPCRHCGEKERKAVVLHEFGDPILPSQVNIFCPKCKKNQVFALRPSDQAMALAKMEMKGEKTEVVGKPIDSAEEMMEYAKLWTATKLMLDKEAEKTIKDEEGQVIMNPDDVKKEDAKRAKKK